MNIKVRFVVTYNSETALYLEPETLPLFRQSPNSTALGVCGLKLFRVRVFFVLFGCCCLLFEVVGLQEVVFRGLSRLRFWVGGLLFRSV